MNVVNLERDFDIMSAQKRWEKVKPNEKEIIYYEKDNGLGFDMKFAGNFSVFSRGFTE